MLGSLQIFSHPALCESSLHLTSGALTQPLEELPVSVLWKQLTQVPSE